MLEGRTKTSKPRLGHYYALVSGLFVGFVSGSFLTYLGFDTPTSDSKSITTSVHNDTKSELDVDSPEKHTADPGRDTENTTCEAELTELNRMLRMQEGSISFLEEQLYGTPLDWSGEWDEKFLPEAFQTEFPSILTECGIESTIAGFDCSEPLCFAVLRVDTLSSVYDLGISECAAWNEVYGEGITVSKGSLRCQDGTEESFLFVGPHSKLAEDRGWSNYAQRIKQRKDTFLYNWNCE